MRDEQPPSKPADVVAWAKRWQPKWQTHITFPENVFFVSLYDFVNRTDDLDITILTGEHRLLLRFEHAYDPEGFHYSMSLPDIDATFEIVPFKPDYGVLKKRSFSNRAKEFDRFAQNE